MTTPNWQPPETAPRDGTVFLADFGWPWAVAAAWSSESVNWACAMPAAEYFGDGCVDRYFENEREDADSLRRWMPMPEL